MPEILLPCAILKLNELKILTALLHNVFMHHYEKKQENYGTQCLESQAVMPI